MNKKEWFLTIVGLLVFFILFAATVTLAATYINIDDSWKTVTEVKVNVGNTWKTIQTGYGKINIGNTWKTIP